MAERGSSSRPWRVGLLGLGHWYSAYGLARGIREYQKATLVAVAWHQASQLHEFASTFGLEACTDPEAILSRDDIDIVQIAAPVAAIPDLTIRAARAGKHIVLGKPMAMTVAQADEMVAAVQAAGITCVAFQGLMRLRASALEARIARGELGDIILMHQASRWSIAEDWYRSGRPGWFVDPAQVPGGALIDEGIYWIDLFRHLARSEVVEVEARTRNLVHTDIAVEDWGFATLTFASGVIATLEGAWTINAPRTTGPSPKGNAVVRLEVVGTRGEYVDQWFRSPGRAILAAGAEGWVYEQQPDEAFAPGAPFPLDHLIDCLEKGVQSPAGIEDARRSFIVAMAAYESARRGRSVRLEW